MRLLLVDSYDSFVHNLAQAFESLGAEVEVVASDALRPEELPGRADRVVLGPGPGRPEEAGRLVEAVQAVAGRVPLLGVCLGHQAIGLSYGGRVVRHVPVHGHAPPLHHDGTGPFAGLPPEVAMTRYHSLVVAPEDLPPCLRPCAWSHDGAIMAMVHRELPVWGVQFHPESVLSEPAGLALLRNFVALEAAPERRAPGPVAADDAPGLLRPRPPLAARATV